MALICYAARMSIQSPSEPVRAWLAKLPQRHEPAVAALRALISSVAPDAHEIVYHDALGYGPSDSGFDRILYIAVFAAHLNLGFFYGTSVDDPAGLLTGTGKRMRHVTIRSAQECANPALPSLIRQAWANGGTRHSPAPRRAE